MHEPPSGCQRRCPCERVRSHFPTIHTQSTCPCKRVRMVRIDQQCREARTVAVCTLPQLRICHCACPPLLSRTCTPTAQRVRRVGVRRRAQGSSEDDERSTSTQCRQEVSGEERRPTESQEAEESEPQAECSATEVPAVDRTAIATDSML